MQTTPMEMRKALERRLANYEAVVSLAVGSHADACRVQIALIELELAALDAGGQPIVPTL